MCMCATWPEYKQCISSFIDCIYSVHTSNESLQSIVTHLLDRLVVILNFTIHHYCYYHYFCVMNRFYKYPSLFLIFSDTLTYSYHERTRHPFHILLFIPLLRSVHYPWCQREYTLLCFIKEWMRLKFIVGKIKGKYPIFSRD